MVTDTVRQIFAFCDDQTLMRAMAVSDEWAVAAQDDLYWKRLCQVKHGVVAKPVTVERWVDWFETIEQRMQAAQRDIPADVHTTPVAQVPQGSGFDHEDLDASSVERRQRCGSGSAGMLPQCIATPKILKGRRDHAEPEEERDGIAILESGEVMIEEDRATFVDASFEEDFVIRRLSSSPTATAVLSPYRVPVHTHRDGHRDGGARASSEPNITMVREANLTPHRPTLGMDALVNVGLFKTPPPVPPPQAHHEAKEGASPLLANHALGASTTPPTVSAGQVYPPASTPPQVLQEAQEKPPAEEGEGRSDDDIVRRAAQATSPPTQGDVQWEVVEEAPEVESGAYDNDGDVDMQVEEDAEEEQAAPAPMEEVPQAQAQPSTSVSIHSLLASIGAPVEQQQPPALRHPEVVRDHAAAPPQLEPARPQVVPREPEREAAPVPAAAPQPPIRGGSPPSSNVRAGKPSTLGRILQPPTLQSYDAHPPQQPQPQLQHSQVGQRWQPPQAATPPTLEPQHASPTPASPQLSFDDNESHAQYMHAAIKDYLEGNRHTLPEKFSRMVHKVVLEAASLRAMYNHQKQACAEAAEELLNQQAKNTQLTTKNIAVSSRLEESKRCVRKLKKGISDTKNTTLPLHNELLKVRRHEEQAVREELEDIKVQAGKVMAQRDQLYQQLQEEAGKVAALQDLVVDMKEQHEVDLQTALSANCSVQTDSPLEAQNASLRINLEGLQTVVKQSYIANQDLKQRLQKEDERQQQVQEMQHMYQRLLDERQHERSQWSQYEEKYLLQIQALHRALQQQQALNTTLATAHNVAQP